MALDIKRVGAFKNAGAFRARLEELGLDVPVEENILKAPESPLAQSLQVGDFRVGNRYCIHPMEGWDATSEGHPTPDIARRWRRFGESGAKLLWGMEAIAVRADGRANPNQLILNASTIGELRRTADEALEAHAERYGTVSDLLWGLQLTHSGRFCRPHGKDRLEPKLAYAHPLLNRKFGLSLDHPLMSDDDIRDLIDHYVEAARLAAEAGIPFVDVKQCHGYLGHEFLSAFTRPGPYGGESLEERTRFAREIIHGIRQVAPKLMVGVRLSVFDYVPFKPDPVRGNNGNLGPGVPEEFAHLLPYRYGFGINRENPLEADLGEPIRYLRMLKAWGVSLVNVSCGSPYYNPHIQRPALFPPSDGYQPPEDPLIDVARQVQTVRALKLAVPEMPLVSSGLTYLQEFLPHTAQALVRQGWTDFAGMGRMVLSYPGIISDSLERGELAPRMICRTFSDCTTAPRNGVKSGCYPLDDHYRDSREAEQVRRIKKEQKERLRSTQETKAAAA